MHSVFRKTQTIVDPDTGAETTVTVQKPVQREIRTQFTVPRQVHSVRIIEHEEIIHYQRPRKVQV